MSIAHLHSNPDRIDDQYTLHASQNDRPCSLLRWESRMLRAFQWES